MMQCFFTCHIIPMTSQDQTCDYSLRNTATRPAKSSASSESLSPIHASETSESISRKPSFMSRPTWHQKLLWGSIKLNWIQLSSPNFSLSSKRLRLLLCWVKNLFQISILYVKICVTYYWRELYTFGYLIGQHADTFSRDKKRYFFVCGEQKYGDWNQLATTLSFESSNCSLFEHLMS